nr:MAG TPA: membrane protein [Caudoviricetes sp.]
MKIRWNVRESWTAEGRRSVCFLFFSQIAAGLSGQRGEYRKQGKCM